MMFGIRGKLALPLVIALAVLTLIFHFYFLDKLLEDELEHYFSYEVKILKAIEPVVSRLILSGDYAELYASMDEYDIENEDWKQIAIFDNNGRQLYPITELKNIPGKYVEKMEYIVTGDEAQIATLNVWIDWENEYKEITEHVNELELISLIVFLVVFSISVMWLNRLIRKPIVDLEVAANKISLGDYDSKLPAKSYDELGKLTRTFEIMSLTLKENEESLIKAKELAEKASSAKSELLARVTHELRTPMNAIIGFGQLINTDLETPLAEPHKVMIEEMLNSGQHLLSLIDEVLELSRIESNEITMSQEVVNLINVIHECITMISPLADERAIKIINKITDEQDIEVFVDYERFREIVLNILSNAVKYNRENKTITLTVKNMPTILHIGITDQGEGLSKEDISKLFQPFERLGRENSDIRGIGMGLVISKRLIELMGGSINIESTPGEGTTVWITVKKPDVTQAVDKAV